MNKATHFLCLSLLSFVLLLQAGCCFGNRKCKENKYTARFRFIDIHTGQDLAFGPSRQFNPKEIKFYSLIGTDTVFHNYAASHNSSPGGDSLLSVVFDNRKPETVFVRLNGTDTDTLQLSFNEIDASPCCPDYTETQPIGYNNAGIVEQAGGVSILKK
jgi:hypothetical protein